MKKQIKYTDEPIQAGRIVKDFLPSPEELVFKEDTVKVTLNLTRASVEFFKQLADENHTKYQQLIRRLVDEYTTRHTR